MGLRLFFDGEQRRRMRFGSEEEFMKMNVPVFVREGRSQTIFHVGRGTEKTGDLDDGPLARTKLRDSFNVSAFL